MTRPTKSLGIKIGPIGVAALAGSAILGLCWAIDTILPSGWGFVLFVPGCVGGTLLGLATFYGVLIHLLDGGIPGYRRR
jgi:hypothetical protein